MAYVDDLERRIDVLIKKISKHTITPKESKIGMLFKALKGIDEVSYQERIEKYKGVLKEL